MSGEQMGEMTEFEPEVIQEFENDFSPDDEFEAEVIREFDEDQVGGNIGQHVNIGLEFRQRVNRFNTEGSAFNVRFHDLENVANLNAFLIDVSEPANCKDLQFGKMFVKFTLVLQ